MEVTLKDESGVSPSSILDKSKELAENVQGKLEESKAAVAEAGTPVGEKIVSAVQSAVDAVVDGVKGLVTSSQVTSNSTSVIPVEPLADESREAVPTEPVKDSSSTNIETQVLQTSEKALNDAPLSEDITTASTGEESSAIIHAVPAVPPEPADPSTSEISQKDDKALVDVTLSENITVTTKEESSAIIKSISEPLEPKDLSTPTDSVISQDKDFVDVPLSETAISEPIVPCGAPAVKLETSETTEGVKIEQLSPSVTLVQDKFIVETVQVRPKVFFEK